MSARRDLPHHHHRRTSPSRDAPGPDILPTSNRAQTLPLNLLPLLLATPDTTESASLSLSELNGSALTDPDPERTPEAEREPADELKGIDDVWKEFGGNTLKLILVP